MNDFTYLAYMALEAFFVAWSTQAVAIDAQIYRWFHVFIALCARQLLDQALIVVSLKKCA